MRTNQARSRLQAFTSLLLAAALALSAASAQADDRIAFLARGLRSDDARVRTNAAVALGGTNDDDAVAPLCGALSDSNDVVRKFAAAALKNLARKVDASRACLKDRLAVETSDSVKLQLNRALDSLPPAGGGGGGASGPPPHVANAKYYVSLSSITNNTGRPQAEVEKIVLGAMLAKFGALGNYQLAPRGETPAAAAAVIGARHLKGYYLTVSVSPFDYSGGNLKVTVRVTVASYPGKGILGEIGPNATIPGTRPGDHSAEDTLMEATAGRAVESFAQNFQ